MQMACRHGNFLQKTWIWLAKEMQMTYERIANYFVDNFKWLANKKRKYGRILLTREYAFFYC